MTCLPSALNLQHSSPLEERRKRDHGQGALGILAVGSNKDCSRYMSAFIHSGDRVLVHREGSKPDIRMLFHTVPCLGKGLIACN